GDGWSSPVVSGGQVFLTSGISEPGTAPSLRALGFDAATGTLRWNREVFAPGETTALQVHKKNSPASPTPIVEDDRVYVHFGHNGTAGLDRDGQIIWRNQELRYDPVHGNGGSPALVGDRLIIALDGSKEPAVVALQKQTGEVLWRSARTADIRQKFSFSTPL